VTTAPENPWGVPSEETIIYLQRLSEGDLPTRKFVVVIVHYENQEEVRELIHSLQSWTERPEEVVVADNSAPRYDWSGLTLPGIPLRVVPSPGNPGYGQAANTAISTVNCDIPYILLLTQDARLESTTASMLLDTLQSDSHAAVAGPALIYRSRPDTYFSLGGRLSKRGETAHDGLGALVSSIPRANLRTATVDWLDGACLMLRADVFRALNGFDPSYFLYVEDVDFQFRVRLTGHKVLINQLAKGAQEPGNFTWTLKRTNHLRLTAKFRSSFHRWPRVRHSFLQLSHVLKRFLSLLTAVGVWQGLIGKISRGCRRKNS
jgi:N-acetylglucosaminyl-diphospho-decaprenol L-rhamnosyltransferase